MVGIKHVFERTISGFTCSSGSLLPRVVIDFCMLVALFEVLSGRVHYTDILSIADVHFRSGFGHVSSTLLLALLQTHMIHGEAMFYPC